MFVVDFHCDTISKIFKNKDELLKSNNDIDLFKLKKGNVLVQCFAIFLKYPQKDIFLTCNKMIDLYYKQLSKNKNIIQPAYSYQDIINNQNKEKISAILTIEEGNVIENNLDNIDKLAKRGVKIMSLTWNVFNEIGYPNNKFVDNCGLTSFGKEVVKRMNENHIIIDVSHLGDKGVEDVLEISKFPIIATHSNIRSVCNHLRNLSDDLIFKIKEKKGIIGINFYPNFVSVNNASLDKLIEHFKYLKKINCLDIVGIGSDFDGIDKHLKDLSDASLYINLINKLKDNNFSNEEIQNICYRNALDFFKDNL